MSKLLILNEKVVDVVKSEFPVHSTMYWVDGEAAVGDGYINDVVVPHVEPVEYKTYKQKRKEQYAESYSYGDQLDIMVKQIKSMIALGEFTVLPETREWVNTLDAIKANNPKPTE